MNPVAARSFFQFEEEKNSEKERIQVVKPEFIEDFVEAYYVRTGYKGHLEIGLTPSEINMT